MTELMTGGCLCGAVRFETRLDPATADTGYCHCRMCQRNAGAPVVAWAVVPDDGFRYTAGTPGLYRSTPAAQREFCATCGSYMVFRRPGSVVSINIASLDEPGRLPPRMHIWCESRIPWFETADALPRHLQEP